MESSINSVTNILYERDSQEKQAIFCIVNALSFNNEVDKLEEDVRKIELAHESVHLSKAIMDINSKTREFSVVFPIERCNLIYTD